MVLAITIRARSSATGGRSSTPVPVTKLASSLAMLIASDVTPAAPGGRPTSTEPQLRGSGVARDHPAGLDDVELLHLFDDRLRRVARVQYDEVGAAPLGQTVFRQAQEPRGVGREQLRQPGELVEVAEMRGHRGDERLAEEVGMAVRCEGIDDVVGRDRDVDARLAEL